MLEQEITKRITAELKTHEHVAKIASASPMKSTRGLAPHEIAVLALILANRSSSDSGTSVYILKENIKNALFTDVAAGVALISLKKNGFVESFQDQDYHGNYFESWHLTPKGEDWLLENQDNLELNFQSA